MTNLETTITQITSSDVQFLTENECREIMGVLAMRHDRISDRELAILEACEDRVYDLEFGDIDMSYEDNYTDAEADADTLASAGWGTDEDYGCFDNGQEW
ncbi:uncharacterized protein METZ01_LOCUS13582 [marine metagenome]|uniref:Uncharacterized protein n=1 Tax=marine metagenome TaxID=408172 RepID=A0A381P3C0_9ZZZZ